MDAQGGCKNFIETATFGPGVEVMFPAVSVLRVKPVSSPPEQDNEDYNGLFPQFSFTKLEHLYIEGSQYATDIFNFKFDACLNASTASIKNIFIHQNIYDISSPEFIITALRPGLHNIPGDHVVENIELTIQLGFTCDWDLRIPTHRLKMNSSSLS
ncbi:hypothetical protein BJ165DRAFT_427445 [Panaeolus papilionaceus]|nr:hypothetical protein BJ165DRAFT_427445 [Panaeolus papilionaceus]